MTTPGIAVGGIDLCDTGRPTIHACKFPCYWDAVGKVQPRSSDPRYLWTERFDGELYLNMIDGAERYFQTALFLRASDWLFTHSHQSVVVHCNQGLSRSPAIVIVHQARIGELPSESFSEAVQAYQGEYMLSPGIIAFLEHNWSALVSV